MPNGYGLYPNMISEDGTSVQLTNWPGMEQHRDLDPKAAIRLLRKLADQIEAKRADLRARGVLR
jgi:hypothetical protein